MRKLIIATSNKKKLQELKHLLKSLSVKVLDLDAVNVKVPKIIEDKPTFLGNAKKKAIITSKYIKDALILADDSGLVVKALGGAPGINSARYAGASQNDTKNIAKLLNKMKTKRKRDAYFICTAVIARNNEVIDVAVGKVNGVITQQVRGDNGFGYDPVFIPKGYKSSFAQMKATFKNRISHRAKALQKTKIIIQKYLREYP